MITDNDLLPGIFVIGFLVLFSSASPPAASVLLAITAGYFLVTGIGALLGVSPKPSSERIPQTSSAPVNAGPTIAQQIQNAHASTRYKCPNCGATITIATDRKCRHCDSVLVDMTSMPLPEIWADVEIGRNVLVKHPTRGKVNYDVIYRLFYGELWQEKMQTNVPWTLTGGYFTGLGLQDSTLLLNWQSRFYLLETRSAITDMDINRNFARYARDFASSNQTKSVTFTYQGANWTIFDIGRFRIEYTEGEGAIAQPGAVGRFIHAEIGNQILVVEDFQSGGGGRDMLWTGYKITQKDIKL